MAISSCTISGNTFGNVRIMLKIPHRINVQIAYALASTLGCTTAADALINYSGCVPQRPVTTPSPSWETHMFCVLCLQGGGVTVTGGGTVAISSCTITGNTARYVRAHAPNFPSPRWETHVLLVVCRAAV